MMLLPMAMCACGFGQEVSVPQTHTVEQLRQMLDASQRRGQLEMDGGMPFHLVATYTEFDMSGKETSKGSLDELWENPRRYRQIYTVPGMEKYMVDGKEHFRESSSLPLRKLVEVDNGNQAWRTGMWVVMFGQLELSTLLKPYSQLSPTTTRLSDAAPSKNNPSLECIGTEPDIPGASDDTRFALTTYCLNKGNHLLRFISLPNLQEISFNDLQPLGSKFIARTITVALNGRVAVKIHVDVLEAASDFHELDSPPPAEAQLLSFHRADQKTSSGFVWRGQLLKKVNPIYPYEGMREKMSVKLHVDATGAVESVEVLGAQNQILKAPVLNAVKQWQYRVSYQNNKAVAVDQVVNFNFGTDDAR